MLFPTRTTHEKPHEDRKLAQTQTAPRLSARDKIMPSLDVNKKVIFSCYVKTTRRISEYKRGRLLWRQLVCAPVPRAWLDGHETFFAKKGSQRNQDGA